MNVHLVDGTYELFRYFYGMRKAKDVRQDVAATMGVVRSIFGMLADGATHVGVATDHIIESFRNELWPDYKDGSGIDPQLRAQFGPLEDALRALGVVVWPMVEYEADDGLGAAAAMAAADHRVDRVFICTPDKDLAQCVVGDRVVQLDRRRRRVIDAEAVRKKFGVPPASIPDFLALVGDDADGLPGIPGWGAKSSAVVLSRYGHLDAIPDEPWRWDIQVRGAASLAHALAEARAAAVLFRRLATVVCSAPVSDAVDDLRWTGPSEGFAAVCSALDAPDLVKRAEDLAATRA